VAAALTEATLRQDEWSGEDVSIADIERQLGAMRAAQEEGGVPDLRTSVMTHTAWVPRPWLEAARGTLDGLAEMHPSRTILLVPDPEAGRDAIDAELSVQCFPIEGETRHVCSETIELHLHGARSKAPASIVEPLLVPDLPVFSRWRGRPGFGEAAFEQLIDVVDRLIVDSSEWDDLAGAYRELEPYFERAAVSDIAWRRSLGWRASLASMWPGIAEASQVEVHGPEADALLICGWLRARLDRKVKLDHVAADELESVSVDGDAAPTPRGERPTASDFLSAELDQFGRDRIYEAAVKTAK
jgi:Glucose-6-phosphate dehydrogenase subunit N-terminal domain/Glucose-6-phosphate dehydrogenase subunit C-terminal domain